MNKETFQKTLARAVALGFSFAFFLGILNAGVQEEGLSIQMNSFYVTFPIGVLLGISFAFLSDYLNKERSVLDALLFATFVLYLGFLKTLGWVWVPWVALVLTFVSGGILWTLGTRVGRGRIILLLHSMGYLSGLYLFLHLKNYLVGWESTVTNLGLLVRWLVL